MNMMLRVGHIDLSFHDASAIEVERILQRHGHVIERSAAPHEEMFRRLGRGEVDVLVSAWLPSSHGGYLAPMENEVTKITVLYEPFCIWGVPDYVPEETVSAVGDLMKEPAVSRMQKRIQGINPGAGISRFSQATLEQYRMADAGYSFHSGTEAECFDGFEKAYAAGRWLVIPLWHPQYLHNRYRIRALEEPLGLLGTTDAATLVIRNEAMKRVQAGALVELGRLYLGNQQVSALDDALHRRGMQRTALAPEA
ncbi:MAG: glycine betaine ABC transporter substrate-binding protein [Kiloniellaceae bacterium]